MNEFVFIKNNYQDLRKNQIGIIKNENNDTYEIEFVDKTCILNKNLVEKFDINKTGDNFSKKICNRCVRLFEIEHFQKNQNAKNNRIVRRPTCNECRDKIDGVGLLRTDKIYFEKLKPHFIFWTCPICNKTTIPDVTSKVVLDHDHSTGKARTWICDSCNTGLGRFNDDEKLLQKAIDYLKKYKNT